MNYRIFGSTGIKVSEIGLGCSGIGGGVFYRDDRESIRVLHRAFDLGINFYDTADSYGYGSSEELIGRAFKGERNRIIIASKVGQMPSSLSRIGEILLPVLQPVRRIIQPFKVAISRASRQRQDFSSAHIKRSIERSLRRLQTEYIDIYQLHNPPTCVLERGEVFETLDYLKNQGKVRFYGVSAEIISDALLCLKYADISSLQVVFNLLEQEAVKELLPLAQQKKIAIIARIPLARGFLTAKRAILTGPPVDRRQLQIARAKVEEFTFLVNENRTLSQAAIQFVLHQPQVSVVIPGTRTVKHLEENVAALDAPPLTEEELKSLNKLKSRPDF